MPATAAHSARNRTDRGEPRDRRRGDDSCCGCCVGCQWPRGSPETADHRPARRRILLPQHRLIRNETTMIRPTTPEDTPALIRIAEGTGVFKPLEITTLDEVMRDYYAENRALGHKAFALEIDGRVV